MLFNPDAFDASRPNDSREAWTTREVTGYLDVARRPFCAARETTLPGYRISSNALRFDPAEVRQWLEERRG